MRSKREYLSAGSPTNGGRARTDAYGANCRPFSFGRGHHQNVGESSERASDYKHQFVLRTNRSTIHRNAKRASRRTSIHMEYSERLIASSGPYVKPERYDLWNGNHTRPLRLHGGSARLVDTTTVRPLFWISAWLCCPRGECEHRIEFGTHTYLLRTDASTPATNDDNSRFRICLGWGGRMVRALQAAGRARQTTRD